MTSYRLKADAYVKYASYKWKACLVFASFLAAAILCSHFESSGVGRYSQVAEILPHLYSVAVMGAIVSFGSIFAFYYAPKIVMTTEIRLTSEGISRAGGGLEGLFLPWEDITSFTELRDGLLIQTADPNRHISLSSDLERYAEIKTELTSRGITALRGDGISSLLQKPVLVLILIQVILLLLGQTLGHAFALGNLFVAVAVTGIGYVGWRNRFRHKSRTLLVLFLLLVGGIVISFPRSLGHVWELSYLAVNGAFGLVAYGISTFREEHQ